MTRAEAEKLIERLTSHMGKAEVPDLLRDCRLAADALAHLRAERDEMRKALEPFAALPTKAHEGQRYSLELLVCPEGDAHPNEWGEKIRNAARLAARTREKGPGE